MRFFSSIVAITAAMLAAASPTQHLEARQEAARFGFIQVNPSTVTLDQQFLVTYNSTRARVHPHTLDFYIQGTEPNGFVTPLYSLQRVNDYPPNANTLTFQTVLPNIGTGTNKGFSTTASYLVWVFGGFPIGPGPNDAIAQGGVSTPLSIEFN